jgi:hypothetical protein
MTELAETPTTKPSEQASPPFAVLPTAELTLAVRRVWLDEVVPLIEGASIVTPAGEDTPFDIVQRMDRGLSSVLSRLTVLMEER